MVGFLGKVFEAHEDDMAWIRILAAVAVYLLVALLTSALVSRRGRNLKEMDERGSSAVLLIGAVANLVVLGAVLLFLVLVDQRPLAVLGLGFTRQDVVFTIAAVLLTPASAGAFIGVLQRNGRLEVEANTLPAGSAGRLLTLAAVLLVVASQEEALYRGYITLNLVRHGPEVVLLVSTLVFAAIHFPTNRVSPAQVASWLFGGFILGWVYLESGSIWVPISLHFIMDMTNVVVFGVAGELGLAKLSRPLSDMDRALYRAGNVALIAAVLLGVYGLRLAPMWVG